MNVLVAVMGIVGTLSSIFFAYIASRKSNIEEHRKVSKQEATMQADIGYIKACVDRVEKNINTIDERYQGILERLTRAEENVNNLQKKKGG